ncbi:hypothetical protein MTR_0094s0100 [Medicago truncatula]|uniref:DUF7745 domain-containing protein n=1 Tax=Medicago truncatula TaxID=3880 RepID=A0A072TTB1_MEDTR|nr:hypothetical protein MTR_0094s0100 [Medicago truncatula]
MSLTPSDIAWYHAPCYFSNIIVSCGEYSNVPLLGTQGGISYNPILAKCQFGCPMETKPDNIYLEAWRAIHKLIRSQLAKKSDFSYGSYTQWVIDRASNLVLPYHLPRYLSSTTPAPSLPMAPETVEECQEELAESNRVGTTWKRKYDEAMLKMETMGGKIEQQEHEIRKYRRQIVKKDVQIRAQSTRLAQFISARERWEFFKDAHSDSEE